MVSVEVHRGTFRGRSLIVIGVLALAATCAPRAALAQRELEPIENDAEQQRLVDTVFEIQSRDGPFSPELIEPFTDLALLYEASGERALAAAAIERTLQLLRANQGLFTLDQLPLLEQAIENQETGRNPLGVEDGENRLRKVIARHPTDVRIVPALHNLGDRQMVELRRLLAGELPAPVCIGAGGCPSRSERAWFMATQAWRYYVGAIDVLLRQEAYTNDELPDLEMKLVRLSYFQLGDYQGGRRSLLRQVSYDVARRESLIDRVRALVRVADWDLLHTNNATAIKLYEDAYAFLKRQDDLPPGAIDDIFSPEVPVMLPDFIPNRLDTGAAGATGYIDVSFAVHRYGSARKVEILSASADATADDKAKLLTLIHRNDFRPRPVGGELVKESPVQFRYYLHSPPTSGPSESSY